LEFEQAQLNKSNTQDQIIKTLEGFERGDFYACIYGEPDYPRQLYCLSEPPPVLFASGPIKDCKYAAIVGTRIMTAEGIKLAEIVTIKCVEQGYAIITAAPRA
jgi:predicted Rossmann fold nucleotide-binding protein DprA/Smf involved in DNA uptake